MFINKNDLGYTGNCVHRFYYYLGMIRSTDQEMTAIEKIACYPEFQEEGAGHGMGSGRSTRKHRGWSGGDRELQARVFIVGLVRQLAKWVRDGLVCI